VVTMINPLVATGHEEKFREAIVLIHRVQSWNTPPPKVVRFSEFQSTRRGTRERLTASSAMVTTLR
jgi:hypothetical protein